ncbi:hypothetical protein Tco_1253335 [Tanacetum coccineum]
MSNTSDKGTTFGDGAARVGMQLRSSPKVFRYADILLIYVDDLQYLVIPIVQSVDINERQHPMLEFAEVISLDVVTIGSIPSLSEDDFDTRKGKTIRVLSLKWEAARIVRTEEEKVSPKSTNGEEEEDEEDVENVYDESANLIQNTKAGGSSSFTAAAG